MRAYVYQAALYCEDCGDAIRAEIVAEGNAPDDTDNESTYDSDDFPKGPYSDGGGESDHPEHCAGCHVFLDAPLTRDGVAYVLDALEEECADLNAANRIMPKPGTAEAADDFRLWHGQPHKAIVLTWADALRWHGLTDAEETRLNAAREILENS